MINREVRTKRRNLQSEWAYLREHANGFDTKAKWDEVIKIRKKEDCVYKQWQFYDGIIKAFDNMRGVTNV